VHIGTHTPHTVQDVVRPPLQSVFGTAVPELWLLALMIPLAVIVWGCDELPQMGASDSKRSATPMKHQPMKRWLARWIAVVTAGEAVGFAVPAAIGVLTRDSASAFPLLLVAGAVEGAILGLSQATVLHGQLPYLSKRRWVVLTAAAAMSAYAIGLLPSTLAAWWTSWPLIVQVLFFGAGPVVLLISIGLAQWLELRHHLSGATWWIPATALSWLVGLAVFFAVAPPLWHPDQSPALAVTIGLVAGVGMAFAMAAVTGWAMTVLLRRQTSSVSRAAESRQGRP